jgi:hypothetical protein
MTMSPVTRRDVRTIAEDYLKAQLCHRKTSGRHTTALVLGFLMPWILLTPLHEFGTLAPGKNGTGMFAVGIVALIALLLWRRAVLRSEGKAFTTTESDSNSG